MTEKTDYVADDATSEPQIRNLILQAAQTWQLETRGIRFYFVGTGD